jgi:phage shock protein C
MTTAASTDSVQSDDSTPLPLRSDTILGVCEGLGQDFGFNPIFLRIPFGALLLWNPVVVLSVYFGLGGLVAATRWFFPVSERGARAAKVVRAEEADNSEVEDRLAA